MSFFPFWNGNLRLFQQPRCEVIVKYTNCNFQRDMNLIKTGIRTLEAQIDEKNNIEARQNVTSFYKKRVYLKN